MDERPPVWTGHLILNVTDVGRAADFWTSLGMREVQRNEHIAVLELRGGTHLVLLPGEPPAKRETPFDLMVDDLDATHARWRKLGLPVGELQRGNIHDSFSLTDPDGQVVSVLNSHVTGPV